MSPESPRHDQGPDQPRTDGSPAQRPTTPRDRRNAARPAARPEKPEARKRTTTSNRAPKTKKRRPRKITTGTSSRTGTSPRQPDPKEVKRTHHNNFIVFAGVAAIALTGSIAAPMASIASAVTEYLQPTETTCTPRVQRFIDDARYTNALISDDEDDLIHSDNAVFFEPDTLDLAELPDTEAVKLLRQVEARVHYTEDEDIAPGDVDYRGFFDHEPAAQAHERLTSSVIAVLNGDHDETFAVPECHGREDMRRLAIEHGQVNTLRNHIEADMVTITARFEFMEHTQWCTGNKTMADRLLIHRDEMRERITQATELVEDTLNNNESVSASREDIETLTSAPSRLAEIDERLTDVVDEDNGEQVSCARHDVLKAQRGLLNADRDELDSLDETLSTIIDDVTTITENIETQRREAGEQRQLEAEARQRAEDRREQERLRAEEEERAEQERIDQQRREEEAREARERAASRAAESARNSTSPTTPGEPTSPENEAGNNPPRITVTVSPDEWQRLQEQG